MSIGVGLERDGWNGRTMIRESGLASSGDGSNEARVGAGGECLAVEIKTRGWVITFGSAG